MKAVILAAGIGSRLRPLTDKKPKALVEVNRRPILAYVIEALKSNKVDEIIICTGYLEKLIVNYCRTNYPTLKFTFVNNKEFDLTNNMFTLFLAKEFLNEEFLLINGDVIIEPEIVQGILNQSGSSVAVDVGIYNEESMKITVDNKNIITGISKKITEKKSYGTSIDLYKIDKKDINLIKSEMDKIILNKGDRNQWTEVMLDNLFSNKKICARPYDINKAKWFEIDDFNDLAKAEILFNKELSTLKNKKMYFIDGDGTLYIGDEIIPGAKEFIEKLNEKNIPFKILTNNSSKTPQEHFEKFKKIGFDIPEKNILVSIQSVITHLKELKFNKLFWLANDSVDNYLKENGFIFEKNHPQALLLTYDTQITFKKLQEFINKVRTGLPYYATHIDIVCPSPEGGSPDIGTYIKVIEMTTNKTPNKTFGKPNLSFIQPALEEANINMDDAVVIGDRIYTDLAMAEKQPLTSILTLTGETSRDIYELNDANADIITPNLLTLMDYL